MCLGIAKVAFRLHIEGQEFIPRTGPVILAANHVSYIDPVIIAIAVRRPVRFMAKKELFRVPLLGWLIRQFGTFPVNRDGTNLQAFKRATSLLEAGEIVAIFPEGTRGDGIRLRPAKPGIGLMAARTGAPVIPVFHKGTEKVFPRGAWLPRPYRIAIKFGMPYRFTGEQASTRQDQVAIFGRTIMEKIAALNASSDYGVQLKDDLTYATGEAMLIKKRGINEPT
ncbi:acyl-phosphate glycerol 3-phosphate acyltransferase [Candidatus Methylomirabilis lanthanidiphila]|uniref:1-acyl-sn-glycerol-3-phosphate acyltransferase n=1 Tax=Candidatus Methylomirabilis lanthanidiphila TaxID=2211376 RepID=A0A564ZHD6_9BACT|nr:1-acyl-sn-glycerol-3-phosphate acyltransferase [Candidatus Methylomirabilis lanthanidiphila]VUZ83958.1 acyl-phosphate glycerol 3-phosphate acyltransferase [Candidatus Methylomirabilis lanthanidiphila]